LPVARIGVLSGVTEAGGPPVVSSKWFTSAGGQGFESATVLTGSVSTEESDLSAFSTPHAASCLQGWFASLDAAGDQIIGVPAVQPLHVAVAAGEHGVGFHVSVSTRSEGTQTTLDEDFIILGGGRVEVALVGEAVGSKVDSSVVSSELGGLEHRLQGVAATS
jgi:hypothetical protein